MRMGQKMNNAIGLYNPNFSLDHQGIKQYHRAFYNLNESELLAASLERSEGTEGLGGTLLVTTGKFTGRSPKDKYIVLSKSNESEIWWENNSKMEAEFFVNLYRDMLEFIADKDLFIQDLYAGADPKNRINVRVISELVWHNLFIRHLLIKPEILILDEATSALDFENEELILDEIMKLYANKTIILITHRKNSLKYCDKNYSLIERKLTRS